jgi:hypothetical protein
MKINIKGSIPVVFFKEGDTFIAHCPVLELSACGDTFDSALKAFNETLQIFLEECTARKTLEKVLESCGWKAQGKKSNRSMSPPLYVGQRQVSLSVPDLSECPA